MRPVKFEEGLRAHPGQMVDHSHPSTQAHAKPGTIHSQKIAKGLSGDPVPLSIRSGAATNKNS